MLGKMLRDAGDARTSQSSQVRTSAFQIRPVRHKEFNILKKTRFATQNNKTHNNNNNNNKMATTKWLVDWRSPMDQWGAGEPQRPCHRPFRFPFFLLFNVFFSYFSFPFPTAVPSLLRSRSVSLFRFFFYWIYFYDVSVSRGRVSFYWIRPCVCSFVFLLASFYWVFTERRVSRRRNFIAFFFCFVFSVGFFDFDRPFGSFLILFVLFFHWKIYFKKRFSLGSFLFFYYFWLLCFFFWFFNDENVSKKSLKKKPLELRDKKKENRRNRSAKKKNSVTTR